jgi:3'-phosphoadenosine 5'-phosphosulfate sulfotransferase (PAPS reductase)/FAD synthetase
MELPPLRNAAMGVMDVLRAKGYRCQVVLPEMADRFFVYMFGRGVPPPSNTFRWCTSQIKIEPMLAALKAGSSAVLTARSARGTQTKDTFSLLGFTAAMEESEARCK